MGPSRLAKAKHDVNEAAPTRHLLVTNDRLNFKWSFETTVRNQTRFPMTELPPLMLQRLSTFVLEILPWVLSGLIGMHLAWNLVV